MRTRVKICGFTRVPNAVAAAKLGVDALGLVFYEPSPRHVEIEQARQIALAIPAFVTTVALFVDADVDYINEVLNHVQIDLIQFHGDEPADFCRSFAKPYIKAVRMQSHVDIAKLTEQYHDAAGLLLDAYHPGVKGGSGSRFDWDLIPELCTLPIILAGGLNPENVRQSITTVRPYALDVSSGVEARKGIKDIDKMATFIKEVNEGDRS